MSNVKNPRALRYRALRAAVGGLLTSSLRDDELKKLANELDLEFLDGLRYLLGSLPLRGEVNDDDFRPDSPSGGTSLPDLIYDRAKARRLSKDRVQAYMREVDFQVAKDAGHPSSTLRDFIRKFVVLAGTENANRLLMKVSGQPEQDPYLVGITDRK